MDGCAYGSHFVERCRLNANRRYYPRPFRQLKLSLCCFGRDVRGGCGDVGISQRPIENYEAEQGDARGAQSNPVQPPRGTDLPIGKLALFGTPLFLFAGCLSGRGVKSGRIGLVVVGWLISIVETTCLVGAIVVFLAHWLSLRRD
jgi:hypothetical protein